VVVLFLNRQSVRLDEMKFNTNGKVFGATTVSLTTFWATPLRITKNAIHTTLSTTIPRIMTLSITKLILTTLSIMTLYAVFVMLSAVYAECHCAQSHYAWCRGAKILRASKLSDFTVLGRFSNLRLYKISKTNGTAYPRHWCCHVENGGS
jgi:hypothetical protein